MEKNETLLHIHLSTYALTLLFITVYSRIFYVLLIYGINSMNRGIWWKNTGCCIHVTSVSICLSLETVETGKEQMTLVTRLKTRLRKGDRLQLRASLMPNNELVWATTDSPFMSTHVIICCLNGQPDVWMLSILCIFREVLSVRDLCTACN